MEAVSEPTTLQIALKRYWDEFRFSSSEKEKEKALNMAVDSFCRLVKKDADVAHLVTMFVEAHIFSFVVGRAFVTDVEKLKIISKTRSLGVMEVLKFFTEVTKEGICHGSNLLFAVEVLVAVPSGMQPLIDSGILSCLIHILNVLLLPPGVDYRCDPVSIKRSTSCNKGYHRDSAEVRRLEVEAGVVHIMKALSSHPSAAQSLTEDDSLQLLFQMVADGSFIVFSRFKQGLPLLHTIQLHRHAMQILNLLLANDSGSSAKYIHKHHLVKILLMAVKDFNPETGSPSYTVGIVDLLLECVELSYKPEADGVMIREDIHNAHGYQFLVQFALVLSSMQRGHFVQSVHSQISGEDCSLNVTSNSVTVKENVPPQSLSPSLSRLLDVLVSLALLGLEESNATSGSGGSRVPGFRTNAHVKNYTRDKISGEIWSKGSTKVKDLEAICMLQDIFLKADNVELQAEVLNRMFKVFSSHPENYQICQQLRTVPLLILNMARFPTLLQDIVLKIFEYAVTVANCIPDQELLSLCCLLQQPVNSGLRYSVLSFFIKLMSFDQKYKKVLREVGVLDVLLDDLKKHRYLLSPEHDYGTNFPEKSRSDSLKKHIEEKDAIISSPKMMASASGKFPIFEDEGVIAVAWDCLVSLLKKAEANQAAFRSSSSGVTIFLPFLSADLHRAGALRLLSCLITEDVSQAHPEELGSLVEILKSGMVTSVTGSQYVLMNDAKCETLGTLWRILALHSEAQRVFGEATAFSLLLTTLSSFNTDEGYVKDPCSLIANLKVFSFVMRVSIAGVCQNPINRSRLHTVLSSQSFYDILCESGLLSMDCQKQVVHLLLEMALEIVLPPSSALQAENDSSPDDNIDSGATLFHLNTTSGLCAPDRVRVYNADAVAVLIRCLLLFTPTLQLEFLNFVEKLSLGGSFNQEKLTSVGCVGLLLEVMHPYLLSFSPLLAHALNIVEVLGAYKLSSSELRILVRYILQTRAMYSGNMFVDMMERLIRREDAASGSISLAPFIEMDMSNVANASIEVPLGQRTWPPAAGYSFICWFQFHNLFRKLVVEDAEQSSGLSPYKRKAHNGIQRPSNSHFLRIFAVGAAECASALYVEVYLQDDGVLTVATSKSCSLSFPALDLEEGRWHHLAVVHSKPNALAGLFQASVAHIYLNGNLRHTGKLGYSPSPVGKPLQVNIGTSVVFSKVSELSWRLRSCYLFEEVLTAGNVYFMYLLGRGYRGLFQDSHLLRFVPERACGGGSMAMLESLDMELPLGFSGQRFEGLSHKGNITSGNGIVWDFERLNNLSLQLSGRKLIFAFDGTLSETLHFSGASFVLNLVDPLSAVASPIGGIPRFGWLHGDIYICSPCMLGDSIWTVGGIVMVLALIEAAENKNMLHMALSLLALTLRQSPQNVHDMQACRGYHLLALFLRHKMSLFDLPCLEIFFQIAACEASFTEPPKLPRTQSVTSPVKALENESYEPLITSKIYDEIKSAGSQGELDDFSMQKDVFSQLSELDNIDVHDSDCSNWIVLSNADMVEHVLLDWTLWVTAPIHVQVHLLRFLERLVSMHWYRNHNLAVLRRMNLVHHLLVTLQRGDVEVPVIEKLVVLLGVILEDGYLASELDIVVRFVIMTFDPPALLSRYQITRESMGKNVIVRNMLLEMLIDLQVTISSEELLEQWYKIVSSKLITYFLDEALHPTSMRWVITLLGVCFSSSPPFVIKFRSSGGFQNLKQALPCFYDSPEIYYTIFCLIFGKPVFPRLPEVRMLDFHALTQMDGGHGELKFVELLDCVIGMGKATFDNLTAQFILARQACNLSQFAGNLVADLEGIADVAGDFQAEALMHKTYAARLMGGEATAPATATSILRFMVDLTKICPPFSSACKRTEFLEGCVDLYVSCARAACAVHIAKGLASRDLNENNLIDSDDTRSSQNNFCNLSQEQVQCLETSLSIGSLSAPQISTSLEDEQGLNCNLAVHDVEKLVRISPLESGKHFIEGGLVTPIFDSSSLDTTPSVSSNIHYLNNFNNINWSPDIALSAGSYSLTSLHLNDSPVLSEKLNTKLVDTPQAPPVTALTSWPSSGTGSTGEAKVQISSASVSSSSPMNEFDVGQDLRSRLQGSPAANMFILTAKHLLEIDEAGYGGGPCSSAATAILDFIAEVLADIVTDHVKAVQIVEAILENISLYVDIESVLVFQGLCLSRLINFLERRLLRDDEEDETKLDKVRWSVNLDTLCWMLVDRVYMGAFPQAGSVLRTLEFLLSMLQLANKDHRIEEASPVGKGLLSISRGNRQLEGYIHALLKNTNRMIMYCFLPPFLSMIGEHSLLSSMGLQAEQKNMFSSTCSSDDDAGINICTVLQLLIAHKRLIFCPSNLDTDLTCCLCLNLIHLLYYPHQNAQNMAMDVLKYLLLHRRSFMGDLLVSKQIQGQILDVLHGGFDKLLTESSSVFLEWLHICEPTINKVLEQCAAIMWAQFITGFGKFPGIRIKALEGRRKREMNRKSRDTAKLNLRHWEQAIERRYALELIRDAMSTELRVLRQDKYGWILHAEREWQTHLQQLVHERGIFSMKNCSLSNHALEWQLSPIEGPYRMRKKLERCPMKIDSIQNLVNKHLEKPVFISGKTVDGLNISDMDCDSFLPPSDALMPSCLDGLVCDDVSFDKDEGLNGVSFPARIRSRDETCSSINDASLQSTIEYGVKSSVLSVQITESNRVQSNHSSLWQSSSMRTDERILEEKLDKNVVDNGEYLIRPYLEPFEKLKFRYNCEHVVGLDKHDGIFLIGECCLYVIENFLISKSGCICEKECEDDLSVIDQALGVKKIVTSNADFEAKLCAPSFSEDVDAYIGGRAWAYNGGAWGREKLCNRSSLLHPWRMWKLDSIHDLLKRDYQLRPVAIEIFSMDGCNDLLVFHKKERDEVFRNLIALNLTRNSMLDTSLSGSLKPESNEASHLFKGVAKSISKRWQNGEISNFQYIMHLNTLAGRGYNDITQYPVFPWVLADYESEMLNLGDPKTFRKLDKPMGCQTQEGEEEFKRRYESWDDPDVPKFHYGSHYSSAGIVLFYLLRLPPFSTENLKLQGGQFDHADRLFNSVRDTWQSAAGRGNTSDVKELIPEFFYLPEFLENRFNLELGEKQSGEMVGDVILPPWAKGSAREFIKKHREALESDYVSENLHHWIDLVFGYKQRGKAAEDAVNVFYHYTYEGSVDIDSISDPAMKASILAQINHFGQTPKQLFQKPHVKRRYDRKLLPTLLHQAARLVPHEVRKTSSITQIMTFNDRILTAGPNTLLKPTTYSKYIAWGYPDCSLRFFIYDQDKLISTHENLHLGSQIHCAGITHDGQTLVTGGDDGVVAVWRIGLDSPRGQRRLNLKRSLCGHSARVTCICVSQPYTLIVSGSDDCSVIFWDLSSLVFVKQLPPFNAPVSAVFVNDLTGEVVTAAGIVVAVWSINGDCLAKVNTTQLPSDSILSVTGTTFSDWQETNWYITGHQSGALKLWRMVHCTDNNARGCGRMENYGVGGEARPNAHMPEYCLLLHKVLKSHNHPVSAVCLPSDLKQLVSGDAGGHLISWTLLDDNLKASSSRG